jgi:uncharacterized protein YjiS (DUF1127 family)
MPALLLQSLERTAPRAAPTTLADHVGRMLRQAAQRLRRWRAAASTRDELAALDAATLRDIGMHRSEAASVAAEVHGLAEAVRQRVLDARLDPRVA